MALPLKTLRKLIGDIVRSDSGLVAFCLDYFPRVHERFSDGMDRVAKVNLLLQYGNLEEILKGLKDLDPEAVEAACQSLPQVDSGAAPEAALPLLAVHPLARESDFCGREAELDALRARLHEDRPGLIALVGIGGSGKSVLVDQLLQTMDWRASTQPDGIFVWSFNWDPDTDSFLRQAYRYLCSADSDATESLGRVYALCDKLRKSGRILFVLDGLESIQSARGTIVDRALRLFLQNLVHGCGRTMALCTTRIPLTDLVGQKGKGYRELAVVELSEPAAAALLAARGVKGRPDELAELARRIGCHALSISLFGAALSECFDGRLSGAAQFMDLTRLKGLDFSARLSNILTGYENLLSAQSIALLERIAVFPRGADLSLLEAILSQPGHEALAGPLQGIDQARLRAEIARLRQLQLVSEETRPSGPFLTAHPAVRDHFYGRLLATTRQQVHQAISQHLNQKSGLTLARTEAELDRIEDIIYHTRQAGNAEDAFLLLDLRLPSIKYLAFRLGEYARGERITRGFFHEGDVERPISGLSRFSQGALAAALGLYTQRLGNLDEAWRCVGLSIQINKERDDTLRASIGLRDLALIRLWQGRLREAQTLAAESVALAQPMMFGDPLADAWATFAIAQAWQGELDGARASFATALEAQGNVDGGLHALRGIHHADFLCRTGSLDQALELTRENELVWPNDVGKLTRCRLLLADLYRRAGRLDAAREYLEAGQLVAVRSGWQEALAQAALFGGRLHVERGDLDQAELSADEGLQVAERCGFTLFHIDLLLLKAQIEGRRGLRCAVTTARRALELSTAPTCGYYFGQADARELLKKLAEPPIGTPDPS